MTIMYNLKESIIRNISNIPGWNTNRHIVVFESDDWGSIRMPSLDAFENLNKAGILVEQSHYNKFDALECNDDLTLLMETLSRFKDSKGNNPIFTTVNVVANPNFMTIKANGYSEYIYEPFTESCERFPNHDNVYDLWKEGINNKLLFPIFHGREHLNAQFWMRALKSGNKSTLLAFENGVTGIPHRGIDGEIVPDFQAAFQIDTIDDLPYQAEVIKTGLDLFEQLYGFRSKYFVPTNGPFNNSLESTLNECGIKYINSGKRQREPLGNGKYKTNTRFLGDRNKYGQIYLTRNCFFEPASNGFENPISRDWVDSCLRDIEIAFRWHKPATISSHRVNYIGYLHPENRENSLKLLNQLLQQIIKKWPDVEFMTSEELGETIKNDK